MQNGHGDFITMIHCSLEGLSLSCCINQMCFMSKLVPEMLGAGRDLWALEMSLLTD